MGNAFMKCPHCGAMGGKRFRISKLTPGHHRCKDCNRTVIVEWWKKINGRTIRYS